MDQAENTNRTAGENRKCRALFFALVLPLAFVLSVCLFLLRDAREEISALNAQLDDLNTELEACRDTVAEQGKTISVQNGELNALQQSNEQLNEVLEAQKDAIDEKNSLRISSVLSAEVAECLNGMIPGYASEGFRADQGIIFMKLSDSRAGLTLCTDDYIQTTFHVETYGDAAICSFDKDSWLYSGTLSIYPIRRGISCFVFSNSRDELRFPVLVIVQ